MVVAPPNFTGDLKISYQSNWGDLSKKLNLEGGDLNFRWGEGGYIISHYENLLLFSWCNCITKHVHHIAFEKSIECFDQSFHFYFYLFSIYTKPCCLKFND